MNQQVNYKQYKMRCLRLFIIVLACCAVMLVFLKSLFCALAFFAFWMIAFGIPSLLQLRNIRPVDVSKYDMCVTGRILDYAPAVMDVARKRNHYRPLPLINFRIVYPYFDGEGEAMTIRTVYFPKEYYRPELTYKIDPDEFFKSQDVKVYWMSDRPNRQYVDFSNTFRFDIDFI